MKTKLRVVALLIALGTAAFWFFSGPNLGWTKTSVTHLVKDPVTEIEQPVYEKKFVPGIDFLGGGLAVAVLTAAGSFFFRKKSAATG